MKANLASLLLLVTTPGLAETAATNAQILCGYPVIVVGRVDGGINDDCDVNGQPGCLNENRVRLSVTVNEVLAVKSTSDKDLYPRYDPLLTPKHVGELIGRKLDLHADAQNWPDAPADTEGGPNLINPSSVGPTNADIRRLYVGKEYIFEIESANILGEPYWSAVWTLKSRSWATDLLRKRAGNDCPALLAEKGRSFNGKPTADSPYRQALISRLEAGVARSLEYPIIDSLAQSLSAARDVNLQLDDASWQKIVIDVDSAIISRMIERGTGLDLALRKIFDTFSISELETLSGNYGNPVFLKFQKAVFSQETEDLIHPGIDDMQAAAQQAMRNTLQKHGLKVPQ